MRKKLWGAASAAGLLAVVLGVPTLVAGASPDASRGTASGTWGRGFVHVKDASASSAARQSHEGGQTVVVRAREIASKDVNVDGRRFGPGDYFLFKENLFNSAGTQVGQDYVQCTAHFPFTRQRVAFLCDGNFTFSGRGGMERGKVTVEGVVLFSRTSGAQAIAITGGTGHYQNARGELRVPSVGNRLTFHLLP